MEGDFFMKKYKKKIFVIVFVLFALISIVWSVSDTETIEPKKEVSEVVKRKENKEEEKSTSNKVIVDVKGAVNNPGVYELTSDNNVFDSINMAGGLRADSDTSNINLSKKLVSEMVIIVYTNAEIQEMKNEKKVVCPPVNNACVSEEDEGALLESDDEDSGLVNINTASKEELLTLSGVGESKALAIIKYREENGAFETLEDIKKVSGIGDSLFEKIKDSITV